MAALLAITVAWLPGLSRISSDFARGTSPLREVALLVDERSRGGDDLIVVHSIPSGIVGVARYLGTPRPMTVRVGQLQRPVEAGRARFAVRGAARIFLVKIRAGGGVAPHEERLRRTATLVAETSIRNRRCWNSRPATSRPAHFSPSVTRKTRNELTRGQASRDRPNVADAVNPTDRANTGLVRRARGLPIHAVAI